MPAACSIGVPTTSVTSRISERRSASRCAAATGDGAAASDLPPSPATCTKTSSPTKVSVAIRTEFPSSAAGSKVSTPDSAVARASPMASLATSSSRMPGGQKASTIRSMATLMLRPASVRTSSAPATGARPAPARATPARAAPPVRAARATRAVPAREPPIEVRAQCPSAVRASPRSPEEAKRPRLVRKPDYLARGARSAGCGCGGTGCGTGGAGRGA